MRTVWLHGILQLLAITLHDTTNHIDNIRFPVKKEKKEREREVISRLLLRG
jgi:hypothetical protein